MLSIAHLVNPVRVGPESDLFAAQPITFESMRAARAAAACPVELWTAALPEDHLELDGFTAAPPLPRSVVDLHPFGVPRKLPLIDDLLRSLHRVTQAPLLIYSNVDIGLRPEFYRVVAELADHHDAFSIRRRTIAAAPSEASDLAWLSAQPGTPHAGHDCFVFRRELLADSDFGGVCIGFPPVGQVLLAALSTLAERFAEITDRHLTFHANDKQPWRDLRFEDYWLYNQRQGHQAVTRLAARRTLSPLAQRVLAYLSAPPGLVNP